MHFEWEVCFAAVNVCSVSDHAWTQKKYSARYHDVLYVRLALSTSMAQNTIRVSFFCIHIVHRALCKPAFIWVHSSVRSSVHAFREWSPQLKVSDMLHKSCIFIQFLVPFWGTFSHSALEMSSCLLEWLWLRTKGKKDELQRTSWKGKRKHAYYFSSWCFNVLFI